MSELAETVVVGGSAAGLAVAASLKALGRSAVILEATDQVAAAWRGHYDRLHLHTSRGLSALPGLPMPRSYPRYPARLQVIEYLEAYARHHQLEPRFGQRVSAIRRAGEGWQVEATGGSITCQNVVIATGNTRVPKLPRWPGQEGYSGSIRHSSSYRNGKDLAGKRVLVIGFGNSGGEIAIDLHEHGARPDIAVRSAVNVIPRDILGLPALGFGVALGKLPPRLADLVVAPIVRLTVGNIDKLGFRRLPYGPQTQIRRNGRIPLLDIGTMALIRQGQITVRPDVASFEGGGVRFADGTAAEYDAIILATGYRSAVGDFLHDAGEVLDADGAPRSSGQRAAPGLYFCGYHVAATGMLREIAIEARRIAHSLNLSMSSAS